MKTIQKLIACFAFLVLTTTAAFSTSVPPVAKVGNTEYSSFGNALAAWTNGTTLTLLADVTVSSTITVGIETDAGYNSETHTTNQYTYTLDLNNHGIMFTGVSGSVIIIDEYKGLTVNDSATTKTDRYITLDAQGRGVSVSNTGTESSTCVKVTGGYITGGNATSGGGVKTEYNSKGFTMNAGTIVGNIAGYGGGIYIEMGGARIKGNSKIIKNIATDCGGGIFAYGSKPYVCDSIQIIDNKKISGSADNVFLCANSGDITFGFMTTSLNENARIGVTVISGHSRIITSSFYGNSSNPKGSVSNFISDDPAYTVVLNSSGEAVLVPCARVTANADPNNTGTYYATFYDSTKKYLAGSNTEVYYATANANGKLTLTKVESKIIKAGEGVILKSTSASIVLTETSENATYDSILTGSDTATTVTNALVLSNGESGVSFYKYTGSVAAHKAWLTE
ncbi:MAG: hypothetical protein J5747_07425 [Spirochaetaceae bacterium]|nr:hypothetical protein [Spirochaetaceae bacterium]